MAGLSADFIISGASPLATCRGPAPRAGIRQADAGLIANGALAALDGRIVFVGDTASCAAAVSPLAGAVQIDAAGAAVVPGFVDPHTHLVFGGDRRDELERRLAGATYAQLAAEGGGIVSTVQATRAADEDTLLAASSERLAMALAAGTTTCEIKSGYGLDCASELKMLRVIGRLAGQSPVEVVATFMGAHEVPVEARADRQRYVREVVDVMLPAVASQGVASWCDVFCETGVFTEDEARTVLEAARRHGLKLRIHADELGSSGGARVAAQVGARSADHLVHVSADDMGRLREAGVVATLLPCAAFFLKLGRFAPARALIEATVPVALATDVNPGGGLSPSMPFVMSLACFGMGMTLGEALVGATLNAAYSLDRDHDVGSLEVGKQLDAVIVDGPLGTLLHVGRPLIRAVIKRGRVVWPSAGPTSAGPGLYAGSSAR